MLKYDTEYQQNILNSLLKDLSLDSIESYEKLYNSLLDVEIVQFSKYHYHKVHPKELIVLHHSAGWDNARGMFNWWENDGRTHVATSIGITDSGKVFKGFDEQFWAHHIGMRFRNVTYQHKTNTYLNQRSIAAEICNWGPLILKNGHFYPLLAKTQGYKQSLRIQEHKVAELSYKGYHYFERYTDEEIESLRRWILLNALRFNINISNSYESVFNYTQDAHNAKHGLVSHNAFRKDKSDIAPHDNMLLMLETLNKIGKFESI